MFLFPLPSSAARLKSFTGCPLARDRQISAFCPRGYPLARDCQIPASCACDGDLPIPLEPNGCKEISARVY